MVTRTTRFAFLGALVLAACGSAPAPHGATPVNAAAASAPDKAWVARSDENTKVLLAVTAKVRPEWAASLGVDGVDEHIVDMSPGHEERERALLRDAIVELKARQAKESDPRVKQDLAILVQAADLNVRQSLAGDEYEVPYVHVTKLVFGSMLALLDDQIPAKRRAAALVRLKKYAGLEPGTTPLTELAKAETVKKLAQPGLMMPSRLDVQNDLAKGAFMREGIGKLFAKYQITGYEDPLHTLEGQLAAYDDWVRAEILPKARETFAFAPPIYALALERAGVDIPQAQLESMAHAAFTEIQGEMQQVAKEVARERNLPSADYRDVIHELKKEQIGDDAVLAHYQKRLADIEGIIRKEGLVTLPARPARIRLGTPAENAQQPAAHMKPPRMLGNTGEQGEFVLPLSAPGATGAEGKPDDNTFAAASWTLTAHEARPGHELQFASMLEHGVSEARMIYAFNSVNIEGWGLYAEWITLPFMPADGKLISLQFRLLRAARAFLDPELEEGKWIPETAFAFLQKEVCASPAFARSEVDRYTFLSPGQATAYFYGYSRLRDLRKEVEAKLGSKFNAQKFHDSVLAQGLLPPKLLREAVMSDFDGG